ATDSDTRSVSLASAGDNQRQLATTATKNDAWRQGTLPGDEHAEHSALWRFKCKISPKFIKRCYKFK
ncbi:hypothetical protein A2U01_0115081, partial [Trifolium medium]|nr:hypothetical protein [Trifolium medium]